MSGPVPTLCPVFPEAFLQQARREVRRKTAPYQTVQRYRWVLLLHENAHMGHAEVGERVGLSGRQVQRWRQRWVAGDFSVEDRSGRGRSSIFSPPGSGADQVHRV
jgi:hypothetical protein